MASCNKQRPPGEKFDEKKGECPPDEPIYQTIPPEWGKSEWPELLGTNGEEAVAIIKSENPNLTTVFTILVGTPVTRDFRLDRVWVWVNECGIVAQVPKIT